MAFIFLGMWFFLLLPQSVLCLLAQHNQLTLRIMQLETSYINICQDGESVSTFPHLRSMRYAWCLLQSLLVFVLRHSSCPLFYASRKTQASCTNWSEEPYHKLILRKLHPYTCLQRWQLVVMSSFFMSSIKTMDAGKKTQSFPCDRGPQKTTAGS